MAFSLVILLFGSYACKDDEGPDLAEKALSGKEKALKIYNDRKDDGLEKGESGLSLQSENIRAAIQKMPGDGDHDFLSSFPKNAEEFNRICNSPNYDELYDCKDIFYPHVERLLKEKAQAMGDVIAKIASQLTYGVDAPEYLRRVFENFCVNNPQIFIESVRRVGSEPYQKRSILFLNNKVENSLPAKGVSERCIGSLKANGYFEWAKALAQ